MIETVSREILRFIVAADTAAALSLLQTHKGSFLEPIEGALKHAELLYFAIKYENQAVLKFLLALPVISDITFFRFCGHTPLSYAIEENHDALFSLLLAKTDKNFALHMAVKLNFFKTKSVLLKHCTFKAKLLHFLELPL